MTISSLYRYEAGFISDDERFNHLISEDAWANAGDPFRCRYLTRSTDSRFVPLGWSGGTRALRVIGNQQQARYDRYVLPRPLDADPPGTQPVAEERSFV